MKGLTREQAEAVQRMLDLIEDHLDTSLDLGQLAKAANYSPFHATRLFAEGERLNELEISSQRAMKD